MSTTFAQITQDKVLVVDFGSQVTHLICRRARELGAYSELISCHHLTVENFHELKPRAVILSGGPSSVYESDAPHLAAGLWNLFYEHRIPVLGICYGLQEMMWALGGKVEPGSKREFGHTELELSATASPGCPIDDTPKEILFEGIPDGDVIWMSHGDKVPL